MFVDVGACMWDMQLEMMASGRAGHFLDSTCLGRKVHVVVDDFINHGHFVNCSSLL